MRSIKLYLEDISGSIEKINSYLQGMSFEDFFRDLKTTDAVIRNFQIIGEAAKHVPQWIKEKYPEVDWSAVVGMRNIIVHQYHHVDLQIIWKTVKDKLPLLLEQITRILNEEILP